MEPIAFKIRRLEHVRHYFTPKELQALERHGAEAERLEGFDGILTSSKPDQRFNQVASGDIEPSTPFEFLWLKYKQNCSLDDQITDLSKMVKSVERLRLEEGVRLQKEVDRQRELIAKLQRIADRHEPILDETVKEKPTYAPCHQCGGDGGAGGRCPRCSGNGFEP